MNGDVPVLQRSGGVVSFLRPRGAPIASPALVGQITEAFKQELRAWGDAQAVPWLEVKRGDRQDAGVEPDRRRVTGTSGVVLVGVAQARATAWRGGKRRGEGAVAFDCQGTTVGVNPSDVYCLDEAWGPGLLKIRGSAPDTLPLGLNGPEWAKRQLPKPGRAFEALDNGFRSGADPAVLQATGDRLGPSGVPAEQDTPRQMGYDLRRLVRKGRLRRLGRRLALVRAKLLTRVLRPGRQALDPLLPSPVSPALRSGLQEVDIAVRARLTDARLVASSPSTLTRSCRLGRYEVPSHRVDAWLGRPGGEAHVVANSRCRALPNRIDRSHRRPRRVGHPRSLPRARGVVRQRSSLRAGWPAAVLRTIHDLDGVAGVSEDRDGTD
jgi:hypothetical protein